VREGQVGRAAKSLIQSGFLYVTDIAVLEQLRVMHPPAPKPTPQCPKNALKITITVTADFIRFIRERI
jgi:hypothetical protein